MNENIKFYKCPICGNVIYLLNGNSRLLSCCNHPLEELIPNQNEALAPKHKPVYEKLGDKLFVKIGEVTHPMIEEHYIMWIALVSGNKVNIVKLEPGMELGATFTYEPNATIYAYCNLHGLWKTQITE